VDAPLFDMTLTKAVTKDYYSEAEAARSLGITIAKLHRLLDKYVFNVGGRRPSDIQFTDSDLLLLSYWNKESSETSQAESRDNVIAIDDHK
jgi:hypothetical protein